MLFHIIVNFIFALLTIFVINSCNNGIINADYTKLNFNEEYTLTAETWLTIHINSANKRSIHLYKNNNQIEKFSIKELDTLYHIPNLQASTDYEFKIEVRGEGNELIESKSLVINTLGLSTSEFSWIEEEVGEFGSIANDIYVAKDGKGFCVGYFVNESSNNDFNGLETNENNWEILYIPVKIWGNDTAIAYPTLYNILYYSQDDIWFTTGGEFIHFNGVTWDKWDFLFENLSDPDFGRVRDVCIISKNNYMAVGDKGSLYQYDGSYWKSVSSPTQNNLHSVSAFSNYENEYVWYGGDQVLYYKNNNSKWIDLSDNSILFDKDIARVTSIIQYDSNNLFLLIRKSATSFLYRLNPENLSNIIEVFRTPTYCNQMTIMDKNDIVFINNSGGILHFNGKDLIELPKLNPNDHYYAIHSSNQNIFIVGDRTTSAVIISGTK